MHHEIAISYVDFQYQILKLYANEGSNECESITFI